jgi:hypothetical protein
LKAPLGEATKLKKVYKREYGRSGYTYRKKCVWGGKRGIEKVLPITN